MKYAIIKTQGKQYKVQEGDVIEIDNIQSKNGADERSEGARLRAERDKGGRLIFENVLLLVTDNNVKIGKPKVSGAKVTAKVLRNFKGEKIRVAKFKAKSRYRRVTGFRPSLTQIQIEKIE